MRTFRIVALLFVLSCSPVGFSQEGGQDGKGRQITTSGESVVYVAPDEVIVSLGVESRDPRLENAKATNDEASANLVAAIKKLGVEDRYIQTDQLAIGLVYRDNRDIAVSGYSATRGYAVTLKDPKLLQKVVEAAIKNGANRLSGVEFRTTELRKHRDAARTMAIGAAKEKAEALAGALGCNVGHPKTIAEGAGYSGYWGASAMGNSARFVPGEATGGDEGSALPLGQIAVRANVTVTFDLNVMPR